MMKIYCITLSQPWATLVVRGLKLIETRGRNTNFRGELHIHAGKSKEYGTGANKISCRELCYHKPFSQFITPKEYDRLPFGAIIGKVNLRHTLPTEKISKMEVFHYGSSEKWSISQQELAFGDYLPGRYGYLLSDPVEFPIIIPAKGNQIIPWEFDMPEKTGCYLKDGSHASFDGIPDQKTVEAVEALVDAAKKMMTM